MARFQIEFAAGKPLLLLLFYFLIVSLKCRAARYVSVWRAGVIFKEGLKHFRFEVRVCLFTAV